MKIVTNKRHLLALSLLALAACSSDPSVRKQGYFQSGKKYFDQGKYQEAVIEFRNAIEIDTKFAEAHLQLAHAYLRLNATGDALRELQETVKLAPQNSGPKMELAPLLITQRQYEQADSLMRAVLKADPQNAQAHAILGLRYQAVHDFPNAIQEIKKAIQSDPKRVEYGAALGAVYLSAGQPSDAEGAYKKAIEVNPRSVEAHVNLGQFYFFQRRMADAVGEMHAASALDSRAVPPRVFLGRIYTLSGKFDDAEKVYRELKTIAPDDPQVYQALALFYASTGQKPKAVGELRSLLASKPKDAGVNALLIENLIDLNQLAEAETLNTEVLRTRPTDPAARLSNGRILLRKGKPQQAIAEIEQAINVDPKSARSYYFLGVAQEAAGLSGLAKGSFSRALELNPAMAEASSASATINAREGDYEKANRLATQSVKANPNLPQPYVASAEASLAGGDAQQTQAHIEEALQRDPTSLTALSTMLKLYSLQGRSQEAVQRLTKLIQQHPESGGLHFLLAVAYFDLKDLDRSEASLKRAMALDPMVPGGRTLLANIDYSRGSIEKAQSDYRSAIDANPRAVANYLALASLYQRQGNWDEAKKLCEKAHQIDPSSPAAAAQLAFLYLEHGGDVNIALNLAQMAKQRLPNSGAANDILGWAYYKLGSPETGLVQLKEAVGKDPGNPIFLYHLGMTYMAAGRRQPGERALQQALKNRLYPPYAADAQAMLAKITKGRP